MSGDTSASAIVSLQGSSALSTATTAAANVSVSANDYGTAGGTQTQVSEGDVSASTNAVDCCGGWSATLLTTAAGNVISAEGYTATRIVTTDQTTAAGTTITADSDVYMLDGNDVTNMSTASGNSVVVNNEWGYTSLGLDGAPATQDNGADVDAASYVELDHWSGYAVSSAYGVGNSALVSNVGTDTAMYTTQSNTGDVSSSAALVGQSWVGGSGMANAVSIGNATSTYLCNLCGDSAVYGGTSQMNSGNITATGYVNTPVAGMVMGSATAIGNASTFGSGGGGN
ncbi:MAG: holdfast anchor protein HfaD [Hyphomonas sp.]